MYIFTYVCMYGVLFLQSGHEEQERHAAAAAARSLFLRARVAHPAGAPLLLQVGLAPAHDGLRLEYLRHYEGV